MAYLREQGHRVLNADITNPMVAGQDELQLDLTDAGQVFDAMSAFGDFADLDTPKPDGPSFDAVSNIFGNFSAGIPLP